MAAEVAGIINANRAACDQSMSTDEFANLFMTKFWSDMILEDGKPTFVNRFAKATGFYINLEEK